MEVLFGNTSKRKNSTLIPSVSTNLGDCLLKSPSSVVTPVFELYSDAYPDYNYCYISQFHRYYFITDISSIYNGGWEISCLVDVLATYKTGILNTNAFVERASSIFNPTIPDTEIAMCTEFDVIESGQYLMPEFNTDLGYYVVTMAGNSAGGFVTNWCLTASNFGTLAMMFFNDDKLEQMSKYTANPISLITNCIWVPFTLESTTYGRGDMYAGNVNLNINARVPHNVVHGTLDIPLKTPFLTSWKDEHGVIHNDYSDYRNTSPYITTELSLPGVGLVNLDTVSLMSDPTQPLHIIIDYYISPCNGDVEYLIKDYNGNGQIVMCVQGNCSVQIPVAGAVQNYLGKEQATFSALTSGLTFSAGAALTAAGIPAGIGMMIGGAGGIYSSAVKQVSANQHTINVKGSLGGWAGQFLNDGARVIQRKYKLSGSASAIGKPYFNTARLGSFNGYVKCAGAYIGVNATDTEHNMLISMVNGGFYIE